MQAFRYGNLAKDVNDICSAGLRNVPRISAVRCCRIAGFFKRWNMAPPKSVAEVSLPAVIRVPEVRTISSRVMPFSSLCLRI